MYTLLQTKKNPKKTPLNTFGQTIQGAFIYYQIL